MGKDLVGLRKGCIFAESRVGMDGVNITPADFCN